MVRHIVMIVVVFSWIVCEKRNGYLMLDIYGEYVHNAIVAVTDDWNLVLAGGF
jgi:hypothetical protein